MKKMGLVVVALALAAGAWLWLGRGNDGGPNAPLRYAPADTPYVFGNIEPLPPAVVDRALSQSAELVAMSRAMLGDMRKALEESDAGKDARTLALFDAIAAELDGKSPREVVETIGIGLDSHAALYGIGLVPVLRTELASPDNLRSFIARMEKAAGEPLLTAKLESLDYWVIRADGAPLMGIAAIIDTHFVLSLAPVDAEEAVLRALFGLDRPASNVLDSGKLAALNKEYGFLPYFSGYLDTRAVIAALQANSPVHAAFLTALALPRPQFDEVCRRELDELGGAWPRLVAGYETFDTRRQVTRFVVETRSDIATALMKLRTPMPGLGRFADNAMWNLGLSLNIAELPGVVGGFAARVQDAPWHCEDLGGLNMVFSEANKGASNPMVYAAAPVFSGAHAVITDMKLGAGVDGPDGSGALVIGSRNPDSLLATVKTFLPQLARVDFPADGRVVTLPAMPDFPGTRNAYAARGDTLIALGVGDQSIADALPGMLVVDPAQQPLLVVGISSDFYAQIADLMEATAEADSHGDPSKAAMIRRQAAMMRDVYSKLFRRIDMRLELTAKGIEFRQTIEQP